MKILVIDDDHDTLTYFQEYLIQKKHEVLLANNGKEGLKIFETQRPEIVFVDYKLPDIDGIEVLNSIKGASPMTQVVLITAYEGTLFSVTSTALNGKSVGGYDVALKALRGGVADYLKKPFSEGDVDMAIKRCEERIEHQKMMDTKPKILIMDDYDPLRNMLAQILAKEDWQIFTAKDGQEGIDMFKKEKPDVCLVDIKMPKKDGLTVLREIKAEPNDCAVMIVTGHGDDDVAKETLSHGAYAFFRKPLELEQIISEIEKVLKEQKEKRNH